MVRVIRVNKVSGLLGLLGLLESLALKSLRYSNGEAAVLTEIAPDKVKNQNLAF
jgi:hypothetical protein